MPPPSVRDALLARGMEVIHRKGYAGAGVADITAAAGAPKGSFYNHFPGKEAFAVAALEAYTVVLAAEIDAALTDDGPALDRLGKLIDALIATVEGPGVPGCLIGVLAADAPNGTERLRRAVEAQLSAVRDAFAQLVAAGQADGSIAARTSAASLADVTLSAFEGAALRARVGRSQAPLDVFRQALPALLSG